MIYNYPVHIQTNPVTRIAEAAIIPDLGNERIDLLNPAIQAEMETLGRTRFLELYIAALLRQKDEDDEDIIAPNSLESYETPHSALYLFATLSDCQPKKITGHAIALVGSGNTRAAYFIENKKFVTRKQAPLTVAITLSGEGLDCCHQPTRQPYKPIEVTRENAPIIDPLIADILARAKRLPPNPADFWLAIRVNHCSRTRCHCCEDYLPTITRITLTLEWLCFIPISAGTLKLTEKKLFPTLGNDALNYSTYITTIMNTLVVWYMTTRGPGSENQNILGHTFDTLFHAAKRLICCTGPRPAEAAEAAHSDPITDLINILLKAWLAFLTLVFVTTSAAQDFTNTLIMSGVIEDPDAWPSPTITTDLAYGGFGFNQFNDPALIMGFYMFGLIEINNYIHRRRLENARAAHIEEVKDEKDDGEEKNGEVDLEAGTSKNADLHERLLSGIAPLSQRLLLHSPRPVIISTARPESPTNLNQVAL